MLDFFGKAPAGLVSSPFCDVAFAQYFSKGHDEDVKAFNVARMADFPWLYAYNASSALDTERNVLVREEEVEDDDDGLHGADRLPTCVFGADLRSLMLPGSRHFELTYVVGKHRDKPGLIATAPDALRRSLHRSC